MLCHLAIESVRRGLQDEGMADLASQVKLTGGSAAAKRVARAEALARRKQFAKIPPIFLPRVLHREGGKKSEFRLLDYERDILGELDWGTFRYSGAEAFPLAGDGKSQRTKARIDVKKKGDKQEVVQELFQETSDDMPEEGIDLPFLVRQLINVVPNPWQGMRIFEETLTVLRGRGASEQQIYADRFDLLKNMKSDIRRQANESAEALFKDKLKAGKISFHLVSSDDPELNWKLAETLVVDVSDEDRELQRKNGNALEKSLFEPFYQRDFNNLEKDTAWYLDDRDTVFWWHRIAVNQSDYSIQGWQRNKVFPDFLACIHGVENGKFRFSVLETKGDHLKGNDDTEYKQKLFDLLTAHASSAIRAGELKLGVDSEQMNFTMLMEDSWKEKLENAVLVPTKKKKG